MSDKKTHDYTDRGWGRNYNITDIQNEGMEVSLCGWGNGITEGDYILLKNGSGSTRYRIDEIKYFSDPRDMWSAAASFAPRDVVQ